MLTVANGMLLTRLSSRERVSESQSVVAEQGVEMQVVRSAHINKGSC